MRQAHRVASAQLTPVRVVPVVLVAALAVVALDQAAEAPPAPPASSVPAVSPPQGKAGGGYAFRLSEHDIAVETARSRVEARPGEWLFHEQLARALLGRGRLTGSYDDLAAAQQALDEAFRNAPAGAGPHLTQAILHLLMHKLAGAEAMVEAVGRYAVPPDRGQQADLVAMRGEIAFYRGNYPEAWQRYEEAERLQPGSTAFQRAIFYSKIGQVERADRQFDAYERQLVRPGPQLRANVELQRGILDLDAGRWPEALAHFRRADAMFPGWWLVEEHIAETTALLGDAAGAERIYRGVIERTGAPEFMDALVPLLEARGANAEAEQLRRTSRALWEARMRQFPEASYGHAVDHCAAFGDRECALRLARANHAARPYGEAGERLAAALADAGRIDEARQVVDQLLWTWWRTAPLLATAATVYEASGQAGAAAQLRAEALRLNPHIFD